MARLKRFLLFLFWLARAIANGRPTFIVGGILLLSCMGFGVYMALEPRAPQGSSLGILLLAIAFMLYLLMGACFAMDPERREEQPLRDVLGR